jgi:hypothetical protein
LWEENQLVAYFQEFLFLFHVAGKHYIIYSLSAPEPILTFLVTSTKWSKITSPTVVQAILDLSIAFKNNEILNYISVRQSGYF